MRYLASTMILLMSVGFCFTGDDSLITMIDSNGSKVVAFEGPSAMLLSASGNEGVSSQIINVRKIMIYDLDSGYSYSKGICGDNHCFSWTNNTFSLIIDQPAGLGEPHTTQADDHALVEFGRIDDGAPDSGHDTHSSGLPKDPDVVEPRSIIYCRTCGFYPEHYADLENYVCTPPYPTWCMRCVSKPCGSTVN